MSDTDHNTYGSNLRRAMDRKGVRPVDIAELTGASSQVVTNWRKRGVSAAHATIVAEYLGVRPEKISQAYAETFKGQQSWGSYTSENERLAERQQETAARVKETHQVDYDPEEGRPSPHRFRLERLVEVLQQANLSYRDMDLLEDLIYRLSRGR